MQGFWTKARDARLIGYRWSSPPLCFFDIGVALGCSKNAAIGRAQRLAKAGIEMPKTVPAPQSERSRKSAERMRLCRLRRTRSGGIGDDDPDEAPKVVRAPPLPRPRIVPLFAPRPPAPDIPAVTEPSMGVTLFDLQSNSCRYPLGPKFAVADRFCGVVARDGSPYCRDHHRLCYEPLRARARSPSPQIAGTEAR